MENKMASASTRLMLGAVLAGGLLGCGDLAEQVASEVAEEAVEGALKEGGVNVDLEVEGDGDGAFTVAIDGNDDASITVDSDSGEVEVEAAGGSATFNAEGADLPEGWPAELALPDVLTLVGSGLVNDGGSTLLSVSLEGSAGAYDQALAHFKNYPYEVVFESETNAEDNQSATISWALTGGGEANLILSADNSTTVAQLSVSGR